MSPRYLNAAPPTRSDELAARLRAQRDIIEAKRLEDEFIRQRDAALRADQQRLNAEIEAHNTRIARCRRAEIEVQRAEADARDSSPTDSWWRNRARAARERFSLDCW